jgi:hypothetical protein
MMTKLSKKQFKIKRAWPSATPLDSHLEHWQLFAVFSLKHRSIYRPIPDRCSQTMVEPYFTLGLLEAEENDARLIKRTSSQITSILYQLVCLGV